MPPVVVVAGKRLLGRAVQAPQAVLEVRGKLILLLDLVQLTLEVVAVVDFLATAAQVPGALAGPVAGVLVLDTVAQQLRVVQIEVVVLAVEAQPLVVAPALSLLNGGSSNGSLCRTGRKQHCAARHRGR